MTERKPISPERKAKLKPETKYVWVVCMACECEFEATERRAKKGPRICFDCFFGEEKKDDFP